MCQCINVIDNVSMDGAGNIYVRDCGFSIECPVAVCESLGWGAESELLVSVFFAVVLQGYSLNFQKHSKCTETVDNFVIKPLLLHVSARFSSICVKLLIIYTMLIGS